MRISGPVAALALLLASCGGAEQAPPAGNGQEPSQSPAEAMPAVAGSWDLVSSGEGAALVYPASGDAAVRLFCPVGGAEILVNVPGFRPVGSEERLSFGSGGEVVALVADTRGDAQRGGVSGTGAVPDNLPALVAGPIAVNYGAQNSGPHPAPPAGLARAFVSACRDGAPPPREDPPAEQVSACLMQGDERLRNPPLRAIGTEPFWGARIEGRCVTYSHPEDQDGTRVWTKYTAGANGGGAWTGALGGRRFELSVRPQAGCSDGMSDRRYPYAADLIVSGERRKGCAERL